MNHGAIGKDGHVRAFAARRRLAERDGDMAGSDLAQFMLRPGRHRPVVMAVERAVIKTLRFEKDHRVGVLDGRDQQTLGVLRVGRHDDL